MDPSFRPSSPPALPARLVVDEDRYLVTLDGQPVAVTPFEFRILAKLASDPLKVWRHNELLRELWGEGSSRVDSNTVKVHVSHLRHKLGRDVISTVWNIGYSLRAAA